MAGWPRGRSPRGKSGLHEARAPGNARRGQPQGKRHREETAAPRGGKGETVGQEPTAGRATGPARQAPPGAMPNRGLAGGQPPRVGFRPEARVGSTSGAATRRPEEWPSMGGDPRDRIRLTGHPRTDFPRSAVPALGATTVLMPAATAPKDFRRKSLGSHARLPGCRAAAGSVPGACPPLPQAAACRRDPPAAARARPRRGPRRCAPAARAPVPPVARPARAPTRARRRG